MRTDAVGPVAIRCWVQLREIPTPRQQNNIAGATGVELLPESLVSL